MLCFCKNKATKKLKTKNKKQVILRYFSMDLYKLKSRSKEIKNLSKHALKQEPLLEVYIAHLYNCVQF